MIVFDLICGQSHRFEVWFRSSEDFARQQEMSLIECPQCGATDVKKALMAPNIGAKSNQKSNPPADDAAPKVEEVQKALKAIKEHVETHFDDVGDAFSEEARRIHYGEVEERGIYGNASAEDVRDLLDEGIEILPLPGKRRADA